MSSVLELKMILCGVGFYPMILLREAMCDPCVRVGVCVVVCCVDVVNHRAMQQKTHLIETKHTRPPPGLEFQHDCDQTFL